MTWPVLPEMPHLTPVKLLPLPREHHHHHHHYPTHVGRSHSAHFGGLERVRPEELESLGISAASALDKAVKHSRLAALRGLVMSQHLATAVDKSMLAATAANQEVNHSEGTPAAAQFPSNWYATGLPAELQRRHLAPFDWSLPPPGPVGSHLFVNNALMSSGDALATFWIMPAWEEADRADEESTPAHHRGARLHDPTSVRGVGVADDIGARPDMEDSYVFIDAFGGKSSSAFMAIYDGHGGRRCVDFVSKRLHEEVLKNLTLDPPPEPPDEGEKEKAGGPTPWATMTFTTAMSSGSTLDTRPQYVYATEALVNAYTQTDEAFRNELQSLEGGCTAVTCLVQYEFGGDRTLYCAHVGKGILSSSWAVTGSGDSRAVLCRGRRALRLTSDSDHKATDPVEVARITQKGGIVVNDRVNGMLAIARALGDFQLKRTISAETVARAAKAREEGKEMPPVFGNVTDIVSNIPDVASIVLKEASDHFLILACDGVWDVITDQEAVDLALEVLSKLTQAQLATPKEGRKWPMRCGTVAQVTATALVRTPPATAAASTGPVVRPHRPPNAGPHRIDSLMSSAATTAAAAAALPSAWAPTFPSLASRAPSKQHPREAPHAWVEWWREAAQRSPSSCSIQSPRSHESIHIHVTAGSSAFSVERVSGDCYDLNAAVIIRDRTVNATDKDLLSKLSVEGPPLACESAFQSLAGVLHSGPYASIDEAVRGMCAFFWPQQERTDTSVTQTVQWIDQVVPLSSSHSTEVEPGCSLSDDLSGQQVQVIGDGDGGIVIRGDCYGDQERRTALRHVQSSAELVAPEVAGAVRSGRDCKEVYRAFGMAEGGSVEAAVGAVCVLIMNSITPATTSAVVLPTVVNEAGRTTTTLPPFVLESRPRATLPTADAIMDATDPSSTSSEMIQERKTVVRLMCLLSYPPDQIFFGITSTTTGKGAYRVQVAGKCRNSEPPRKVRVRPAAGFLPDSGIQVAESKDWNCLGIFKSFGLSPQLTVKEAVDELCDRSSPAKPATKLYNDTRPATAPTGSSSESFYLCKGVQVGGQYFGLSRPESSESWDTIWHLHARCNYEDTSMGLHPRHLDKIVAVGRPPKDCPDLLNMFYVHEGKSPDEVIRTVCIRHFHPEITKHANTRKTFRQLGTSWPSWVQFGRYQQVDQCLIMLNKDIFVLYYQPTGAGSKWKGLAECPGGRGKEDTTLIPVGGFVAPKGVGGYRSCSRLFHYVIGDATSDAPTAVSRICDGLTDGGDSRQPGRVRTNPTNLPTSRRRQMVNNRRTFARPSFVSDRGTYIQPTRDLTTTSVVPLSVAPVPKQRKGIACSSYDGRQAVSFHMMNDIGRSIWRLDGSCYAPGTNVMRKNLVTYVVTDRVLSQCKDLFYYLAPTARSNQAYTKAFCSLFISGSPTGSTGRAGNIRASRINTIDHCMLVDGDFFVIYHKRLPSSSRWTLDASCPDTRESDGVRRWGIWFGGD
ncbi:hypothetical protein FOZ61_004345 [Perkinsus olseni]|uniref:PPM-type phosphatase domain-containing protein n=1 Tax=Perkinsus olseni TaxID=32597 RepID=A0A7J6LLF4_PEROL|nr:hypothetical protein FOZ61_004345 [Perkinsus olseni]